MSESSAARHQFEIRHLDKLAGANAERAEQLVDRRTRGICALARAFRALLVQYRFDLAEVAQRLDAIEMEADVAPGEQAAMLAHFGKHAERAREHLARALGLGDQHD